MLFAFRSTTNSTQNKIKGKVILAKNGQPLYKVFITIKGKRGTTTDENKVSIYNYADRNKMGDSPRQINLETEITILKNLSFIAEVCKQYRCNILQNCSAISFVKGLEAGKINNAGLVNI